MKNLITILFLSILLFSCVEQTKNEPDIYKPDISIIEIGQIYNLDNFSTTNWKPQRVSFANEYTTTYLFENTYNWNWLYITIDNKTKKVKEVRSKNQRTR